jgi:hypothetical protein
LTILTGVLFLLLEQAVDLVTNLTIRHLHIILGLAVLSHEGEVAIVRDVELRRGNKVSKDTAWAAIAGS